MRKIKLLSLLWALPAYIFNVSIAHADSFCGYDVANVAILADGTLNVALLSGGGVIHYYMCNVGGSTNVTISPGTSQIVSSDTCRSTYTSFLSAKAANRQIALYFSGLSTCPIGPFDGIPANYPLNVYFQ